MTREEEIDKIASAFAIDEVKDTCNPASKRGLLYVGFVTGAEWADAHPHWISVEDELPKEKGWILAVAGDVDMFEYEGESTIVLKDMYHITHWMPLPEAPSSSEKPNNCEKGGEE